VYMKQLLLLLLASSLSVQAQGTLNNGMLGRFPFDNNLADVTGNISNASSINVAYGPDTNNQANAALRLVGTGEVAVQPNGLLDFGSNGSFTFTVAFRTLSSGTQAFFSNAGYSIRETPSTSSSSGLSQGWSLGFSSTRVGKLYVSLVRENFYNGPLALATQASFNDGLWHTAALVVNRSGRQIRIFVDGSAQPLSFISSNPSYGAVSGSVFNLEAAYSQIVQMSPGYSTAANGTSTINNRFGLSYNGWLDEARFYNRVLTDAEVQTLSGRVLATLSAREAAAQMQVAPNPVGTTGFTVTLAKPVASSELRVVDSLGRTVPVTIVARQAGNQVYELSGLPAGLYLLHVNLPQGVAVQRVQVD
jgi:hypothetical protein